MTRPNFGNEQDACCRCGKLHPTPLDGQLARPGDLEVWQPTPMDPPQWICTPCKQQLEQDAKRVA